MMSRTPPKMRRLIFQVKREDIDYIRNTMESYDGMALVRTVDPHKALIEIYVAPRCERSVFELIESLRRREEINIIRHGR